MQSSTSFALWLKVSIPKEAAGEVNLEKTCRQSKCVINLKRLGREGESGYRPIGME